MDTMPHVMWLAATESTRDKDNKKMWLHEKVRIYRLAVTFGQHCP